MSKAKYRTFRCYFFVGYPILVTTMVENPYITDEYRKSLELLLDSMNQSDSIPEPHPHQPASVLREEHSD